MLAAFLAGLLSTRSPAVTDPRGRPAVNLLDPQYPPMVVGEGWGYHETAEADLDGDGAREAVSVIARATGPEDFDDGQPWQVYIEEPDGRRTHVYSRWVQLGHLEVYVSDDEGKASLIILEKQGFSLVMYRVYYGGPGVHSSVLVAGAGITHRTVRRQGP